jgi:hypothetical protein
MGRIVHEDVDTTELVYCMFNDGSAMIGILDITGDQNSLPSLLLARLHHFLRVVVFAEIGDQDTGPSLAYAMATARPIPLSPPVMTARGRSEDPSFRSIPASVVSDADMAALGNRQA